MGIVGVLGFGVLLIYRHGVIPVVRFIFGLVNLRRPAKKVPPIQRGSLLDIPAVELSNRIKNRECTAVEVMEVYIARIKEVNPIINAVVDERFSEALAEAAEIDRRLQNRDEELKKLAFTGVPFTVKVAFSVKGLKNTSGLVIRKDVRATEDAVLVTRMRKAGGIPVCVSNVSEVCMWWESANLVHGRTRNPYDDRRIVGGSSGGEGALLAAGASVIGVGSDIGGSIRMPAFFNGVFGHKCTSGMIANCGQFPNADGGAKEFMVSGPLVRFASDLLPVTRVMAGPECSDRMQLNKQPNLKSITYYYIEDIGDYRFTSSVEEDIRCKLRQVVRNLEQEDCIVKKLNLPLMQHAFQMWAAKMGHTEQTRFRRLLGNLEYDVSPVWEVLKKPFGLSKHTAAALLLGCAEKVTLLATAENESLVKMCDELGRQLDEKLAEGACLLMPTHPTSALFHNEPLFVSANFAYTGIINVLGLPATAVPLGLDSKGVPVGIQIVGRKYDDYLTLAVAKDIGQRFGGWVRP